MSVPNRILTAFTLVFASVLIVVAEDKAPTEQPKEKHPANRLAKESSPYLLLHAHNPVDWYPWGPEAFEAAKKQNKPIFLSIGYSSCYWCHVMERLVFENPDIAKTMNEKFINIKVDREERPDVDDIYMTSLLVYYQLIRSPQGGGWPLSMFLTPEGKPFAGGTYFPPEDIDGRMGFTTVVAKVNELWSQQEKEIRNNAEIITRVVQQEMKPKLSLQAVPLEPSLVDSTVKALKDSYDPERGGLDFNPARPDGPKFPVPSKLRLLMNRAKHTGDEESKKIVLHTLEQIAMGGIRDHLAGGFHRYSTDRAWLVPHFEKMLYDQAQLVPLYLDAWEMTQRPLFREAAETTLDFVLKDMTGANGEFYSAMDAETESIEGKSYVWSREEILAALGESEGTQFCAVFGLDEPNPFEHGFVLHLPRSVSDSAAKLGVDEAMLNAKIIEWKTKLLAIRDARPKPLLDDKSLTSWNGLMIGAFAEAGRVLEQPKYTDAATRAAEFLSTKLRQGNGVLYRTARNGEAKLNAYLDDYAFAVDGLLKLFETTKDEGWLTTARDLTDKQTELFWDETAHGFYFTSHDHEALIARTKNAYDAVLPAGNSVAVANLVELSQLTGDAKYLTMAEQTLQVFAPVFAESPRGMSVMSLALLDYLAAKANAAGEVDDAELNSAVAVNVQLDETQKVKIRPLMNVDKLPPGKTCRIVLYVEIEKGWHINQNPPQPEFSIPTVFKLKSSEGVTLKNIKYPTGKQFRVKGIDEPMHVYEGTIAIHAELEVPAAAAGKSDQVSIELDYQPCNDTSCLRKMTATVSGKVSVADKPEDVKPANEKHFEK